MLIHGQQKELSDFNYDDFELVDYEPHPAIKAPIAV
jgi:thymidylate synthase